MVKPEQDLRPDIRVSPAVSQVLRGAKEKADKYYVSTANLLRALSQDPITKRVLTSLGISQAKIQRRIRSSLESGTIKISFQIPAEQRGFNPTIQELIKNAGAIAQNEGRQEVLPEDLLACMLKTPQSQAGIYLADLGLTEENIPQIKEAYLRQSNNN